MTSPCLIGGSLTGNGYARVGRGDGRRLAHRVVWEQAHGPIPDGMEIHHTCGVRACVNVDHLEMLTHHEHSARHRGCDHDDRYVAPDGCSTCRICRREPVNRRRRERYHSDPDYRAKMIAQAVAAKRRQRERRRTHA